jgi:nuclear GTP-binding protein
MGILLQKKIKKKVNNHHERMRKLGRMNPHKKKLSKDPGIPNLWPLKEQLINEIESERQALADAKVENKVQKRKALEAKRRAEMVAQAASRAGNAMSHIAEPVDNFLLTGVPLKEAEVTKRHWYFKELKKVVNLADVIIQVLDARDPLGCRCPEVEKMAMQCLNPDGSPAKRIILLLNKIDLVPRDVVQQWIEYFRREYPTLGFKASTQQQKDRLTQTQGKIADMSSKQIGSSACVGGQALVGLLKNYCRAIGQTKKSITVGIVGFPNVGKSSIINSLKRARAVQVGSTPGLTKAVQTVRLDRNISLVDSPGVLFSSGDDSTLVLRNCLRVEQLEDPAGAVAMILDKVNHEKLMELYRIPRFAETDDFLMLIAQKFGKLGRGGVPNLILAARQVLEDWNSNKIPFYTVPPQTKDIVQSVFVSQWSAEFNLREFESNMIQEMDELEQDQKVMARGRQYVVLERAEGSSMQQDDSDLSDEETGEARGHKTSSAPSAPPRLRAIMKMGAPQANRAIRQSQKAAKKAQRRAMRDNAEAAMADNDEEVPAQEPSSQFALQQLELQQRQALQAQAQTDDYDFTADWN